MFKELSLFLFALVFSFNANAVTESELQDIADCMAAVGITNSTMQLNGDHKNYKVGTQISKKLMDVFYDKLAEYKKSNPHVDEVFLGQMPNRSVARYGYMGELQQMKYAKSVLDVNNCFQYIGKK